MAADKKTLLRDALKQVQGGKVDKAIETYRAIVKLEPKDAAVRNALADLLGRQGKKRDAIAEYLEAVALYEKDGFGPRAIAICQKIVKLDPEQWAVRLKLGDLYAAQKLVAEARAIYLQLAERHDKRGDVAAELEIFRRLADLDPANLPMRVKLAGMFEKQKQPDQAAAEYVRAAGDHIARREPETAAQLLVRAFKLSPANVEARRMLADLYAKRNEWQVVVGLLETPVARGGQDTGLVVQYADALTRVDHAREAVGLLEKIQAAEPNAVPVNLVLGRAYLKTGDAEKGNAALSRCVGAHLAENRLDLAEALLQEMAAAAPEDDKILQRLVEVANKRGDADAAAAAYLRLASIYEGKGLVRNAVGALERYVEARPGDAAATARLEHLRAEGHAPAAAPGPSAAQPPATPQAGASPAGAAAAESPAGPVTAPAAAVPPGAAPPALAPAEGEFEIDIEDEDDLARLVGEDEEDLVVVEGEDGAPVDPDEDAEAAAQPAGPTTPGPGIEEVDPEPEDLIEIPFEEEEGAAEPPLPEAVGAAYGEIELDEVAPEPEAGPEPEGRYGEVALGEEPAAAPRPPIPAAEAPAAEAGPAVPGTGASDLFEDLRVQLESEGGPVPPPLEEAGLREIFQEFQRSMREQLSDEDFDTHYNLGIAYKEMGLTEEALGEFSLAEKSPTRRLEAVSMIAICLREQGRLDEAAQRLRTGAALAPEGSGQQKGFLYDLAAVHEQAGEPGPAREALQRLHAMDPGYRDVAARVGGGEPPGGGPPAKSKVSYL